jgi:ATP-binding cassette subfamily B protein
MSMGHSAWEAFISYRRDPSVKERKIDRAVVRRIISFAHPFRKLIYVFLILVVIDALLVVAQPLLFRRIVDLGITPGNVSVVIWSAVLIAAIAVVSAGVDALERWHSSRIGEGLIYDLRVKVFDHVQRQPIAFFTRTQTGALVSRLNNDVLGAQAAFTSTLSGVVSNSIILIIVLWTMLLLSWQITLAALVLIPLFLVPARYIGRHLQQLTRTQMSVNAEVGQQMNERFNVAGALLVKLLGRPDDELAMFSRRAAQVRDVGVKIAMSNHVFFASLMLVASLATALIYGIGGVLVIDAAITLGTLLALTALLARLYGPLTALSNVRVDVMTALVAFERVFEILDLEPKITDRPDAVDLPSGPLSVEFRNVSFAYPSRDEVALASLESVAVEESVVVEKRDVLRNVSFSVPAGGSAALVGPSGQGKTTIAHLICRLYDVTAGSVFIDGVDVRDISSKSLHSRVSVVTQDAHFFHDTIRMNLSFAAPGASEAEMWQACERARIAEVIRNTPMGLDTVVGDRGYRLSGGEKARLSIARLLLTKPGVVILDEATAHLDTDNEKLVQDALAEALAGRTALVIAHRLSTIEDVDEVLLVDDGSVRQVKKHEVLATSA